MMPYETLEELPDNVKKLPKKLQALWMAVFNEVYERYNDESKAFAVAWSKVNEKKESVSEKKPEIISEKIDSLYVQYDYKTDYKAPNKNKYFVICSTGTVGTSPSGIQYTYTKEALEKSVGKWKGLPIVANHDESKFYGELGDSFMLDDKLVAEHILSDEKFKSYIDNDNFEGISIRAIDIEVGEDNKILSFTPAHSSFIFPPKEPACEKGICGIEVHQEGDNMDSEKQNIETKEQEKQFEDFEDCKYVEASRSNGVASAPKTPTSTEAWSFNAEDGNKILEKGGWKLYAKIHGWYDPEAEKGESGYPEKKESYKLPMFKYDGDTLKLYWNGVRAAMAALMGARGGVDIPMKYRKAVYDKIASLYKRFDKEPPEFKYKEVESMEKTIEEMNAEIEKLKTERDELLSFKNEVVKKQRDEIISSLPKREDNYEGFTIEQLNVLKETLDSFKVEIEKTEVPPENNGVNKIEKEAEKILEEVDF